MLIRFKQLYIICPRRHDPRSLMTDTDHAVSLSIPSPKAKEDLTEIKHRIRLLVCTVMGR